MAVIPSYFNQVKATPAISNAQVDPNVAAAPFKAAAETQNYLYKTFTQEANNWNAVLQEKAKEQEAAQQKDFKVQAGIYKSAALADLSIQANQLERELFAKNDGKINIANEFDHKFGQIVDETLKRAPNELAQQELAPKVLAMRSSLYNKVTNAAIKQNNQLNMDRMETMLTSFEGLAAANPSAVEALREQSKDVFKSMEDLGIPLAQREAIQTKFNSQIDYQALRSLAETDPLEANKRLMGNEYAHLGAGKLTSIKNIAAASEKAFTKQADEAIRDAEARLSNGQPLPEDFQARLDLATKYNLKDQVEDLTRLMEVDKMVASGDVTTLRNMRAEIQNMATSGELDINPTRMKKLVSFLDGNIKAMEEDGLSYAERKGGFAPFAPIQDFLKVNPSEAEQRKFRALQVKNSYGVETSALKKEEVDGLVKQLQDAPTVDKVQILNNIKMFGEDTVKSVVKSLRGKDDGMAQALSVSQYDMETASKILQGREAIASKQVKLPPEAEIVEKSSKALKTLFVDEPSYRSQFVQAGKSLYAYETARGNDITMEEAILKAGNLIKISQGMFGKGYSTVAPAANMSADVFNTFLDSNLKKLDLWNKYGNGLPVSAANKTPIKFNMVQPSDFTYLYNSRGFYEVYYEGDPVITDKGHPLAIDLKRMYGDTTKGS